MKDLCEIAYHSYNRRLYCVYFKMPLMVYLAQLKHYSKKSLKFTVRLSPIASLQLTIFWRKPLLQILKLIFRVKWNKHNTPFRINLCYLLLTMHGSKIWYMSCKYNKWTYMCMYSPVDLILARLFHTEILNMTLVKGEVLDKIHVSRTSAYLPFANSHCHRLSKIRSYVFVYTLKGLVHEWCSLYTFFSTPNFVHQ